MPFLPKDGEFEQKREQYEKEAYEAALEIEAKGDYPAAAKAYEELGDYLDAAERIERCKSGIARKAEEDAAAAAARAAKNKRMAVIAGIVIAAIVIVALAVTQVIMPVMEKAALEARIDAGRVIDGGLVSAQVGDTVYMGTYEQDNDTSNGAEGIEWRVLAKEGGRALLVSEYGLDAREFNANPSKGNGWESSDLKAWLAGDFAKSAFSDEEAAMVHTGPVCLSVEEAEEYFSSDDDRMCEPTPYAVAQGVYQSDKPKVHGSGPCFWWLRSAGDRSNFAACVYTDGGVNSFGDIVFNNLNAVRPAIWVNL